MANNDSGNTNAERHRNRRIVEQKIAENEAQLSAARKAIHVFEGKRYELKEMLNKTSPIMSSLPFDILSEIFIATSLSESRFERKTRPVQFLIGRICRAWRSIAWSTPGLWCEVYLELSKNRWEIQKCLLQEWIERGGSSPLELNFSVSYNPRDWDPPVDIFQSIMPSCHRWKKLSCSHAFNGLGVALDQTKHKFPLLNAIYIMSTKKPTTFQRCLTPWNFHSATPHLRELDVHYFTPEPGLGVNWACLTYLSITFEFGSGRSSEILGLACSLEVLHCRIFDGSDLIPTFQLPTYSIPHLKDVTVEGLTSSVILLLRSLNVPSLQSLTLEMEDGDPDMLWTETIAELARRSSCNLVDLDIDQNNLEDEVHILDMLRQLSPSIKTFHLRCYPPFTLSNMIINQIDILLQRNEGRQHECLPNLKSFYYNGDISFTLKAMSHMMQSRQQHFKNRVASDPGNPLLLANSLRLETEDTENDSTCLQMLSICIFYSNANWFHDKHPNKFYKFCQEVTALAADGVKLELGCTEDCEEDDSDPE
ncbi:hypothetical protein GALMADRAFT_246391 [Galerina marginata CBS 339.88]|uniref:Uncharacterized protein n=1 Tax=Galerina marginata (strain CBS 339.88) TaxID=685588 RepID=A0A067T1S9_GALM3|nr:hypothetical protein GALMADRAFT_246391 [Galerina marginata CBS 339.88]